jgi:hypothetical protein
MSVEKQLVSEECADGPSAVQRRYQARGPESSMMSRPSELARERPYLGVRASGKGRGGRAWTSDGRGRGGVSGPGGAAVWRGRRPGAPPPGAGERCSRRESAAFGRTCSPSRVFLSRPGGGSLRSFGPSESPLSPGVYGLGARASPRTFRGRLM